LRRGQQGGSSASWHAAAIAPSSDLPDGQFCDFAVQPLPQKYFAFSETQISCSVPAVPPPQEGRFAIVTDVERGMRWTLWCREASAPMRTAKSCGPDAPTLASRSRVYPADDGGKRARSPGRARISRKTIAWGMPDVSGASAVNTRVHTPTTKRTRGCGCIAHPAFPAPSDFIGRHCLAKLGRIVPRERGGVSEINVSRRAVARQTG
jgi:hypothetical protein